MRDQATRRCPSRRRSRWSRRRARRRPARRSSRRPPTSRPAATEVVFGPNHRKVHGYLAGTDEERAADLQWALSEPGIDMVHTLCGGYGTARLHDLIDWDAIGEPRIVCGFSDITALHLALAAHAGWVTLLRAQLPALHAHARTTTSSPRRPRSGSTAPSSPSRSGGCSRIPEDPVRAHGRRRGRRGAAGRRLPDAALRQHRHAVRGADRGLHPDGRGPEHRAVPGRHGAQPPASCAGKLDGDRRLRLRHERQPQVPDAFPRGRSRRSRSRRSSTS